MNNVKRRSILLFIMMFLLIVCGRSVYASSSEVTIDDLIIKPGDSISVSSSMRYHFVYAHEGCGYIDSMGRERFFGASYMANYGIDIYGPDLKYNSLDGNYYWIYKYDNKEVPAEIFLPELYGIVITSEPYKTRATNYYLVLKIPEGKPVYDTPRLIRTSYRSKYYNGSTDIDETVALYYGGRVIRIQPDNNDNKTFFLIEWDLDQHTQDYILPECTLTPPEGMVFVRWNLGKPGDTITLTNTVTTLEPQWAYSINGAAVTISDQTYTGKALKPAPTVTLNGKTLESGKDYTAAYSNNTNVGTATATITGCGAYTGTIKKTFKILSAAVQEKDVVPEVWKVTFASGGGSGSMAAKEVVKGGKFTLPACTFTAPSGKEFDKWDKGVPGTEISINADTVITALWKSKADDTTKAAETTGAAFQKDAVSPEKPAKVAAVEKAIITAKNDKDQKGSTFSLLQAKGVPKSKTSIKLTWKKVKGAKKYIIYGNKCGKKNKYEKIKVVTGKSFTQKDLKRGTYYKYLVVAVRGNKALATSKTIHVATKGGKVGNNTGVKLSRTKLSLKTKKSRTIKATLKNGSLKVNIHRKTAWESSNISVAKVSKGKITAVGKGTCYVYAYAQNGVFAKVKVTVK